MGNLNTTAFFFLNQVAGRSALWDWIIIFLASYLAYILAALFVIWLVLAKIVRDEKIKIAVSAIIGSVLGRGLLVESIRFFYHHPRPFAALSGVKQLLFETSYSFPSGHATFFFALSSVAYYYDKKAGIAFFILSGIMGIARIMAGAHYPFDIIGGAFAGSVIGFASCALVKYFNTKNNTNTES